MKLASYEIEGRTGVAAVARGGFVPLTDIATDMIDLIRRWPQVRPAVEAAIGAGGETLPLETVRLTAPVSRPGKIFAIGLNYKDHIAESGLATPEHQLWFAKASTASHAPHDPIQVPKAAPDTLDYEAELVAVIGRAGRHITPEAARDHVFGYCCGNDVSVREWQRQTPQWTLGKSFDTHAPFGPWIVTADEIGDPHDLNIRALVNGEVRQSSNTRHLLFSVWDQIAHLSKAMTLEPGDVIFTGTPGGVGAAMKPPRYLKAGDRVAVEIDRIGSIEAVVEDEI